MHIAVMGMSHIAALQRAYSGEAAVLADRARFEFVQLRRPIFGMKDSRFVPEDLQAEHQNLLARQIARAVRDAALAVLGIRGTAAHLAALVPGPGAPPVPPDAPMPGRVRDALAADLEFNDAWLAFISRFAKVPTVVFPPPPPVESETWIRAHPGAFGERIRQRGLNPSSYRLRVWQLYSQMMEEQAARHGFGFLDLPADVLTSGGFLQEQLAGEESAHGNNSYGVAMLRHIIRFAEAGPSRDKEVGNSLSLRHPYEGLPARAFWKQAVADVAPQQLDPVGTVPYTISRSDRVATAGSCFAQHISKRIRQAGFQFLVTEEPGSAESRAAERGYYDFSARYGNLYTARQLVQLFDRACGYFTPVDSHWALPNGRWCDPFRPRIEPEGYPSIDALVEDRKRHLGAVRRMFEQLDVMVFTLGLTECWISRLDGAALPLAPGVVGGVFDPATYAFVNFGVEEVAGDLDAFIRKLRLVNSKAKVLLTVSPVPLVATYEPRHVLVSTTYSKSVLRVAADIVTRRHEGVCYFPSYEIIASHYNRGRYFGPDLRSVTEEGVDHVMSVFMRRLTDAGGLAADPGAIGDEDPETAELNALAEAECDEEVLGRK